MDSMKNEVSTSAELRLISVNVALPSRLVQHFGRPVLSGFKKMPVTSETVTIDSLNIVGDGQGDLSVHGGPEKAIYAYSADRHAAWMAEVDGLSGIGPAYFGENLTIAGKTENDVRIGDVWAWGSARIQVCQPRWPCYKLALASERLELGQIMLHHGWTGWYFRVLMPGEAPVSGPIQMVEQGMENVTVFDAHSANLPGASRELIERVIAAPALAARWRATLANILAHRDGNRPE
jgi:MOSC domain-containing protein YiiM